MDVVRYVACAPGDEFVQPRYVLCVCVCVCVRACILDELIEAGYVLELAVAVRVCVCVCVCVFV